MRQAHRRRAIPGAGPKRNRCVTVTEEWRSIVTQVPADSRPFRISDADRAVLDAVTLSGPDLVARAIAWSEMNSGSTNLPGLAAVANRLTEVLRSFDGEPETLSLPDEVRIDARGEAIDSPQGQCLRLRLRPEAPVQVALTGHYDTVFPADSPFQTVRQLANGRLNGPGIADMKGGISVMLGALAAFERHPLASRLGFQVLLSPDEETGSMGSAALLAELGRNCHIGLTYEPAFSGGSLVSARKGSGNYHIAITGRAAHAGRDFASGRNALVAAARIATDLADLNGVREGVTINVGRIDGGGALNAVPDRAVLRLDVRVPDRAGTSWIDEQVRRVSKAQEGDGISVHVHGGVHRPAKPFFKAQQDLFGHVRELGSLLGQPIDWRPSGGVCEGNNLLAQGLPGIDTLGVRGGDIHSDREFAWPESFVERAKLSALILCKLAAGEIDAQALRARLAIEQGDGAGPTG
jgi:glutamate carboxypeptidase